jgi:tRNA A-37 threonylcarbamoyl transferase component Bud32
MVKTPRGEQYAMKTFKKTKSIERLALEATLQDMASRHGVSPKIIDVDIVGRTITMEKMDKHLVDIMKISNGNLQVEHQKRLFEIFKRLDRAEVFHGDSNILNYMIKGDKIYIIDFGMGKRIDGKLKKRLGTITPNETLMTLAFILKLKELGSPSEAYSYLLSHVSTEFREKYNL